MSNLKNRLIIAATLWIMLGMIAAGFVLSSIFKQHVTVQFYDELYVHLAELQRLADVAPDGAAANLTRPLSDPRYDEKRSGFYWEIQRSGVVLARSESLQGAPLRTPADGPQDVNVHTHALDGPTGRLLVAEQAVWRGPNAAPIQFVIGTDERHLNAVLANFNTTLAWSLTAFGLSMVVAATLLILYAMSPFGEVRRALANVRTGASKTLAGRFPAEVVPLVEELNTLLTSSSDLIQRARTQAGNLAHGLKTPLAILTDEGYRMQASGQAQSASVVLTQCRKMLTHIDYQIARARAAALRSVPGTVADVGKSAAEVASALERLHKASGIVIAVDVPTHLKAPCDPQDLNEMLANIVDNACKHTKGKVVISAVADKMAGQLRIVVDDDGPGLPPEAFDVVFNLGERWDSRAAGTGLGLTIVRDLARLYGGDVFLASSPLGGLSVTIALPLVMETA